MNTDPDRACEHREFEALVEINRLSHNPGGPVVGYAADISVFCAQCGEPFRWTGVPAGVSPKRPTCSVDEKVLRAPLRPASADPDFGLGLPGYTIQFRPGNADE
jgi:hypothetical protein